MAGDASLNEQVMPKVLLFRNLNEKDARIENIIHHMSDVLLSKHITVTTNFDDLARVHIAIVFLNSTMVRTCESQLEHLVEEVKRRNMILTAVVYENKEDVRLVTDVFKYYEGDYPLDFDFHTDDPINKERLTVLVRNIFRVSPIGFCNISLAKDMNSFEDPLKQFIGEVINYLNPYDIDYTEIPFDLLSEVVAMCDKLDYLRKPPGVQVVFYPFRDPILALIQIHQSEQSRCPQYQTNILQLIYSLNKIRSRREFQLYLYISMPPPDANGKRKLPSFKHVFFEAVKTQIWCKSYLRSPLFIIVDDFHSFLEDVEDLREMLADFVNQFHRGTVVITTYSYPLDIKTKIGLDTARGTQCVYSSENTTNLIWDAVYASELNNIVFSNSNTDTSRIERKAGLASHPSPLTVGQKEKMVHSIHFEESGGVEKKLKEVANPLVHMSSQFLSA